MMIGRARDRIAVLFGSRLPWKAGIEAALAGSRFIPTMADLSTVDPRDADLVVPLTFADHDVLRVLGPDAVTALLPDLAARDLCRDKLALNQWLENMGYGYLVPRLHTSLPKQASDYPLLCKVRCGEWGQGISVLSCPDDAQGFDPRHMFLQSIVSTGVEWAAHLSFHEGRLIHALSVRYEMGRAGLIKGHAHQPLTSVAHQQTPYLALWLEIAERMGLRNGTVCIDFAEADGCPVLYEINPRVGATLVMDLPRYLEACLTALARERPSPRLVAATDRFDQAVVSSTAIA
ncbi:hypothetical protein ACN2XU_13160 [Primorskyibacter sp. 2E107]|uniref:hypothetical protein n=1 Tax=Primorskyibacter sp. 2E107 TaxID=3403458 RepID=UPI003AF953E1